MTDNSKAEDWHADDMAAAIAKFSSKAQLT